MKRTVCALLAAGALALPAWSATEQWKNGLTVNTIDVPITTIPVTELPTVFYNGTLVPALPLPTGLVPLTVLHRYPVQVQALAIKTLISNWMTVYAALNTTGLYQWNHFAIEAASIEARAKTQGITDEILSECAAFSAALKKAKGLTSQP
jgi:hypothetical protein